MARYLIDPDRSRVWITARSTLHPIHSETTGLEGFVDLDSGAGQLSLPVARLVSGNPLQDRELRRRIDARRFPTIDGAVTELARAGDDGRHRVVGDVTFRGVTQRYEDELTIEMIDGDTLVVRGEAVFDIRDFGMQPPRILLLQVQPDVGVRIEVTAVRDGVRPSPT